MTTNALPYAYTNGWSEATLRAFAQTREKEKQNSDWLAAMSDKKPQAAKDSTPQWNSAFFMCYDAPVWHGNMYNWRIAMKKQLGDIMRLISPDMQTAQELLGIPSAYMGFFMARNMCALPGYEMIVLIHDVITLYCKLKETYESVKIYPIPRTRIELKELLSLSGPYVRVLVDGEEKVLSFATELSKGKYKTIAGYQLTSEPRLFDLPAEGSVTSKPRKTYLTDTERSELKRDLKQKLMLVAERVENVSETLGIPGATLRSFGKRTFNLTNDVMLHYNTVVDGYLALTAKTPGLKIRLKPQPTTFKELVARGLR